MFISRHSLVLRRPTRVFQYTPEESNARKAKFAQSTTTVLHMDGINEHYFVNMEKQQCISTVIIITLLMKEERRQNQCDDVVQPTNDALLALLSLLKEAILLYSLFLRELLTVVLRNNYTPSCQNDMYGSKQEKRWMHNRVMEI